MSQPVWQFVANLGDASPIDHGGYFVFKDKTGVYPCEAEYLEPPPDDGGKEWTIHRIVLDQLQLVHDHPNLFERTKSYLVTKRIATATDLPHPIHMYNEWFAKDLLRWAATSGAY
jgi:hypothetical protein